VVVPAAGTITLTYSAAPSWSWAAFGGMPAGNSQARLPKGSVIYADSSAGSSPAQLLYQALGGASSLRAYIQGTDDTAHFAGVSN
jgi:hypothetical protein